MKWSFASVALIIIGLFGIIIIMLFNEITVSNEQDYYTLKEATEAAMIESVDVAYYRLTGEIKISQEKFVENFTRRYAESSQKDRTYKIDFYDINELPPKVSVKVTSKDIGGNLLSGEATEVTLSNKIDAILEVPY